MSDSKNESDSSGPAGSGDATAPEKRFSQLTLDQLNGEQREAAERILKMSSIGLSGPYNPMLRSPVLASCWAALLDHLRFNSSVPKRLSEFAILIEARLWTSQVEWYAHYPIAMKAGLAPSVALELKEGRRPAGMQPDEAAVYDVLQELWHRHALSDPTYRQARAVFTEQQLVDLTAIAGVYLMVAMLLSMADEGVPPGNTPPLQPLPAK